MWMSPKSLRLDLEGDCLKGEMDALGASGSFGRHSLVRNYVHSNT